MKTINHGNCAYALKLICRAEKFQGLQNKEVFVFEVQKCKGCSPA